MKKLLFALLVCTTLQSKATIHTIQVWNGYMQFLNNDFTMELGDTVQWVMLDFPTMIHTITSVNIPLGATPFDQIWQAPSDTFFQYIPQAVGLYDYVCTPHIANGMIGSFTVIDGATNVEVVSHNPKSVLSIFDITGKKSKEKKNTPLFYIYEDGTVEKRINIE